MQKLATGVDLLAEYRTRALSEIAFLSRGRELTKLEAAVASGSPALVEGSPCLGKTRLLLEQLRMEMDVARLSSGLEMAHLLDGWIGSQIGPRIANARRLAQESSQRKSEDNCLP